VLLLLKAFTASSTLAVTNCPSSDHYLHESVLSIVDACFMSAKAQAFARATTM
jgi:hypothetical protein